MAPTSFTEMIVWIMAVVFLIGPGWLLAVRLFPDERPCWQIAVGGGIGIALLGLSTLVLSYLPVGLTRHSIIVAIVVLDGLLAVLLGWAPERILQRVSRLVSALQRRRQSGWKSYVWPAVALVTFLVFVLATPPLSQGSQESYTEFYIVDGLSDVPPWRRLLPASEPVGLTLAVVSHETTPESFQVHLITERATEIIPLGVLEPGGSLRAGIRIPSRTSAEQRYTLALYKGDSSVAYRTLHVWLRTPPGEFDAGNGPTQSLTRHGPR